MATIGGRNISRIGFVMVEKLPRKPHEGCSYWLNSPNGHPEFTHHLFRFPAKCHPPVVRWALETYGRRGSAVLDPFTGSGSVQVEALLRGLSSVGIDVDPLASFISQVKTTPIRPNRLEEAVEKVERRLGRFRAAHAYYEARAGADMAVELLEQETARLWVPPIHNITHWFRRYVIVDLARVFRAISEAVLNPVERDFLRACAASVVRRVSNADPTPVSGLEVTKVQSERNRSRRIRVFEEFFSRTRHGIRGMTQLWESLRGVGSGVSAQVICGDLMGRESPLHVLSQNGCRFPLVITSPPYCNAVDYSRRHRLETYWLGLVQGPEDHLDLAHSYIGRPLIRVKDCSDVADLGVTNLDRCLTRIDQMNRPKGRAVRSYFFSMRKVIEDLAEVVGRNATFVCIIGNSICAGIRVATAGYVVELAADRFRLANRFSYAVRNHYMQYGLRNGDGITKEHVLVFKRA